MLRGVLVWFRFQKCSALGGVRMVWEGREADEEAGRGCSGAEGVSVFRVMSSERCYGIGG